MADMKFSCPECGQHFACGEAWVGHELECSTCHSRIVVPAAHASTAVRAAPTPSGGSAHAALPAGVTQVPRSTAHAPATPRRSPPPPVQNPFLKYGLPAVVILALGWGGYFYGLPLLTNALHQEPPSTPPANAKSSDGARSSGRGALGEVNEAMDVSETLDSGGAGRTRPVVATNNTSRPQPERR